MSVNISRAKVSTITKPNINGLGKHIYSTFG